MPEIRVKLPDGRVVSFPEGTSQDAIAAALKTAPPADVSREDMQGAIDAKAAGQTYNPQHASAGETLGLSATAPSEESPLIRAATQFYSNSVLAPAVSTVKGAANVVAHPIDTLFGIVPIAETLRDAAKAQWDQMVQAAQKAKEAAKGPTPTLSAVEALGHGLAAVLPFLGPAAANVGEHFAEGDTAGGIGGTAGLITPFAAKYLKEAIETKSFAPTPARAAAARAAAGVGKADRLTREAEQTVAQRVLAPANPKYKPTATHLAGDVLDRGLRGDRTALQQAAEQGMADAGGAIDRATTAAGGRSTSIPTQPIVDALTRRIDEFKSGAGVIPTATAKVAHLTELRDYLQKLGPQAPLSDILKIRDEFYQTAAEKGAYARRGDAALGDVAWAAREGGSAIREHLAKLNPDAAAARADYTFWKNLNDVLDPDLGRPKSGAPSAGVTGGRATVGAVAAEAVGSTPLGKAAAAIGLGKILPLIQDTVNSPAWQLAKASQKQALAEAIRKGQPAVAQAWLYRIASQARQAPMASGATVPALAGTTPDNKPPRGR